MKMMKPEKQYKNKIGDILHGEEYLEQLNINELKEKRYCYSTSIRRLSKEVQQEFKKHFLYVCPFIDGNHYYWFAPSFVFTEIPIEKAIEHMFQKTIAAEQIYGWKSDQIKMIEEFHEYKDNHPFYGEQLYMGHGYTDYTLPSDGCNHKDVCMVRLDNGDILVGQTWVWFNK